jgi:hypothetical protein
MPLVTVILAILSTSLTPTQAQPTASSGGVRAAKLLEAMEYSACDYNCAPFNRPTTSYCFQDGDEILVGERVSILGETPTKSMRNRVGQDVTIRYDSSFIWLTGTDHSELKIKRGSFSEHFKDTRCVAEVHKPKVDFAKRFKRPADLPADAFPLAAEGGTKPPFRWFQCSLTPDASDITCKKWDFKGIWNGVDRYCARTTQGDQVYAGFEVDHLISREGQIVLASGETLERDERGRESDKLMRPGEPCYQVGLKR